VPAPAPAADRQALAIGRFGLGAIVATPGAIERMERRGVDARGLLARHGAGDWGDIDPEDVGVNEEALRDGRRLLSAYGSKTEGDDATIWIITEADRSATTILRPEDH
jgi:hypothetical protein